jgi:ferredoxin-NADP reductase
MNRKRKRLHASKVTDLQLIAPNTYLLSFEKKFSFKAGQVIALSLNPEDDPRLYSLCSGEQDTIHQILFDVNPNGFLTPQLRQLSAGATIFISEPFGKFTSHHERAVWIATGTGIAPFVAMTKSGQYPNKTLLHGSRTLDKFFFNTLFKDQLADQYLRFCTKEKSEGIFEGRLTQYLKSKNDLDTSINYYLCGQVEMVIEVREILLSKGIPFNNIIAEIYF